MEDSEGARAIPLTISQELITNFCQEVAELIGRMPNLRIPEEESATSNTCNGHTDTCQEREVNCPICFETFEEEHAPRTLRCGHSVCSPCLEAILARAAGDRNCPECRRPLKVTAVAHIPVSYTILRLSRALQLTSAAAAAAEAEVKEADDSLVGETCVRHHMPVKWWCPGCKDFQCSFCSHKGNDCPEKLPAKEAIIHLKQAQVEETERSVLSLNELKGTLETQRDKLNLSVDHMKETINQLETKIKKVQQQVQQLEEAEALVVEASSACRMKHALTRAEEIQEAAKVWLEHKNSRPASPVLSPEDVDYKWSIQEVSRRVHFTKEMYAVLDGKDGVQRFGRITLDAGKIIVHSFEEKAPPATAVLVSEDSIYFPSDRQMTVFFDIHVDGRFEGRVTMVLFRQTSLTKSLFFIDVCRNAFGQAYKGLPVHSVNYEYGEHRTKVVQIGKEIKGISEHQTLRPCEGDDNYYHRTIYPGLVSGVTASYTPDDENSTFPTFPTPASFVVHLYSIKDGNDAKGFAKVLSGLGVLRYSTWERREVVVGDCGLVLPFPL